MQKFGAGLPIACRALKENGNPSVEFTADAAYVEVVVWAAR
jgi:predicted HTH transcriptional regulator